jgi:arylsulfatase A-like enzyme
MSAGETRGLTAGEAALAGAATLLGASLAEGLVAAASRPSYRAALAFGAPWRLLAPVLLLGAAAGLVGWLVARTLGGSRGRSLATVLLAAALPVLVHALLSPPGVLLSLLPPPWAGVLLIVPLLLALPVARGRALPAVAALLSALQAWWMLQAAGDQSPPGAEADSGWLTGLPAVVLPATLFAMPLLASLPLLLALRAAPARDATRPLLAALAVLLLATAGGPLLARALRPGPAGGAAPDGPTRMLLVVADTLRADHVAGFGAPDGATPRLAELQRDGVAFTSASTAAPWTTPSVGSLLTGRLPLDHGAGEGVLGALRPGVATLAERLAGSHDAAALTSNPLLGRQHGLARGFSRYEDALPPEWYHPLASWIFDRGLERAHRYLDGQAQAARALEAVDEAEAAGRSWLVLAHFMDAHWPYDSGTGDEDDDLLPAAYAAGAAAVDAALGALLDGLRARGVYERTLIVFTSDHGEELLERRPESSRRPRWNLHGHTLHEELLHVPLIIKLPAGDARLGPPGSRRGEAVSLLAVAPTLLEVAGELPPPESAGRSLLQPDGTTLFAEALLPTAGQALAARRGPFKVVVRGLPPRAENAQGFDLLADPGEERPLPVTARPELSALYEALVVRWLRLSTGPKPAASPAPAAMDEDLRRRLRQLGYLR